MNFVFTSSSNTSPDLDTMEVELLDRPKELRVDVDPEQVSCLAEIEPSMQLE